MYQHGTSLPCVVATSIIKGVSYRFSSSSCLAEEAARDLGQASRQVASVVVLALALCTVGSLLRDEIANGLEQATLANLAGDEVVDAVLQVIDLLDTGDLGLAKLLYCAEMEC